MKTKKVKKIGNTNDYIKAIRKGNREAEFEVFGPGFHSKCSTFKSKKAYNRKQKHKSKESNF